VGGFPDGSLLDVVRTNNAVLRGYRDGAFSGRRFARGQPRVPHPALASAAGVLSLPFFLALVPRDGLRGRGARLERRLPLGRPEDVAAERSAPTWSSATRCRSP
jgi:hypothetical protein